MRRSFLAFAEQLGLVGRTQGALSSGDSSICARSTTAVLELPDQVTVTMEREDPPEFKRTYAVDNLPRGATMKVTRYTTRYRERTEYYSELRQRNGSGVLFNAERVADKIIDRELAPMVQALADRVLRIDREFMASHPQEFTDTNGDVWRKVIR